MGINERGQQVWLHARPADSDACMEGVKSLEY